MKKKRQNKILSVKENLDEIKPNLRDIVNDLKQSDTWKIQLTITINLISSKDENDEECVMHSKIDNIEIVISDEVNEIRVSRKFLKAINLFRRKHRKIYNLYSSN